MANMKLLDLPDELLLMILNHCLSGAMDFGYLGYDRPSSASDLITIGSVCRRLRRLVPHVKSLRSVSVHTCFWRESTSASPFVDLRRYFAHSTSLDTHIANYQELNVLLDLLGGGGLPKVRDLRLVIFIRQPQDGDISSALPINKVETLRVDHVHRRHPTIPVPLQFAFLATFANLKELTLEEASWDFLCEAAAHCPAVEKLLILNGLHHQMAQFGKRAFTRVHSLCLCMPAHQWDAILGLVPNVKHLWVPTLQREILDTPYRAEDWVEPLPKLQHLCGLLVGPYTTDAKVEGLISMVPQSIQKCIIQDFQLDDRWLKLFPHIRPQRLVLHQEPGSTPPGEGTLSSLPQYDQIVQRDIEFGIWNTIEDLFQED